MAGMKIVFVFGQSILNRESIFYCLKELLYRHLVLGHRHLTVALILFFSRKKIAQNLPIHPCERLPTIAPQFCDSIPKVDLQIGRFFISNEELELRIKAIYFQFWKIQAFAKFVCNNHRKIKERDLVYADLDWFADFLSMFFTKEFVDPKGMFQKICQQHPSQFLIRFDLCGEKKKRFEYSYVLLL